MAKPNVKATISRETKGDLLRFRVTEKERQEIIRRAHRLRMSSVSEYLRLTALGAIKA